MLASNARERFGDRSSSSPTDAQLYDVVSPHDNDVLCGRGGNEKFRHLVSLNKELYVTSSKRQKMCVSRSIVDQVRAMNPPGRFLERDMITGLYYDVGDRKAIEKTSQALRDGAAELRRQLSVDATADLATTDGSTSSDCGASPATPSPPSSPQGKAKTLPPSPPQGKDKTKCPQKKARGNYPKKPNSPSTMQRRVSGSQSQSQSLRSSNYDVNGPTPWYTASAPRMRPPLDRSYSVDHSWQPHVLRRSLSQPPLTWGTPDRTLPPPVWLTPEPRPAPIVRALSFDPRYAPATLADFTPPPSPARKKTCRPREIEPRPSFVVDPSAIDNGDDDESPSMSPLPLYGAEEDSDSLIMDLSEDLLVIP